MYFYTVVLPPQGVFLVIHVYRWRFTDLIRPMWNQCVSPLEAEVVFDLGFVGVSVGVGCIEKAGCVWWEMFVRFFLFLNDCALILSLCGETINDDFNVRLVTSYALYPAVVTHISHSVILFSNVLKIMPPPLPVSSCVLYLIFSIDTYVIASSFILILWHLYNYLL